MMIFCPKGKKNTVDQAIEMYKIQQEMFIHRTKHFWSVFVRLSVPVYVVILFPYLKLWDGMEKVPAPNWVYSVLGGVAALMVYVVLIGESARQTSVRVSMTKIAEYIGPPFEAIQFDDITSLPKNKIYCWIIKRRIGMCVAFLNLMLQVALAIIVLFVH